MTEGAREPQQQTKVARRPRAPIVEAPEAQAPAALTEFERMQAAAEFFAGADILPELYKKKPANVLIAMEIAARVGQHWLAVAQNLYVANGRPGWMTSYLIGLTRIRGAFQGPIRWTDNGKHEKREAGAGDHKGRYPMDLVVTAHATLEGGHEVSVPVSMEEALADGWTRNAKYRSIPHLMLTYRSASRLIKLYAPEVAHGLSTIEELEDMPEVREVKVITPAALGVMPEPTTAPAATAAELIEDQGPAKLEVAELVDTLKASLGIDQRPQDEPAGQGVASTPAEPTAAQGDAPAQQGALPGAQKISATFVEVFLDRLDEVAGLRKTTASELLAGLCSHVFGQSNPLELPMSDLPRLRDEVGRFIENVKKNAKATAAKGR